MSRFHPVEVDNFTELDDSSPEINEIFERLKRDISVDTVFRAAVARAYFAGRKSILKDFWAQRDAIKATLEKHDNNKG